METAPLKNFATWARKELIREVTARIAAVLAPGSSERVEQAKAVAALEKAIMAAGGGDKGRAAVADKVAYTWFNRLIALRFMDANGYTEIGVVSPQAGVEVGQPEILAEAKRGVIDPEIVSDATLKTVAGLLDGTRASGDPQGEAYALLLESYCNHWHKTMPFMFEREGDFTEVLVPANLLADDSVLNRSVKVLTEDVCRDVEVIGWLYQFYISERKDEIFAGFQKNKKAGADEIPAATQLFTPHWIVRYLVENSLGRLWMLNRPSSGLANQMDYYVAPVDEEVDFLKISTPQELTVIDPACGSGHMLTYAFDLLYAIYEEEGYGPTEIPRLILTHNLYGTEIDPRAGALAAFALTMRARARQRTFFNKQVEPHICVIDPISFGPEELDFLVTATGDKHAEGAFWNQFAEADTQGSLIRADSGLIARLATHLESLDHGGDLYRAETIEWARMVLAQAEFLAPRYAIAIANPPYMGSSNMDAVTAAFAKREFSLAKLDLYAMFIERCLSFVIPNGIVAMVTQDSWMFLGAYAKYRAWLLRAGSCQTLAHLGTAAFHTIGGEVVSTVAFTLKAGRAGAARSVFIRAAEEVGSAKGHLLRSVSGGQGTDRVWVRAVRDFLSVPNAPVIYWATEDEIAALSQGPYLGELIQAREGLTTGSNDTFLRRWFEVSLGRIGFDVASTEDALGRKKFDGRPDIAEANVSAFRAGWNFGETTETFASSYEVAAAQLKAGTYRQISGNLALAYGLVTASHLAGLPLFLGAYPITPASDILHELSRQKAFGVRTFQAEDEIAAVGAALGAAFGGALGVTTSSGPGIALKSEAIGLAVSLELPLVICDIQRGGPSTGLPTKTEQSDLLQAMYGRNGEAPVPIVAPQSPGDCFYAALEAARIALSYRTPVFLLSDGYLANGAEPWLVPELGDLPDLRTPFATAPNGSGEHAGRFLPYLRDPVTLARPWAVPGTPGLEHRIGGIEKADQTGDISYDPDNHDLMVRTRQAKVDGVAATIPLLEVDDPSGHASVLVLGWGSTYGPIGAAVRRVRGAGRSIAQAHLRHLNPFPTNLGDLLRRFERIVVPEMNLGQLASLLRAKYVLDVHSVTQVRGMPFKSTQLAEVLLHHTDEVARQSGRLPVSNVSTDAT